MCILPLLQGLGRPQYVLYIRIYIYIHIISTIICNYTYPKNHGVSKLGGTGDPKEPCKIEGPCWFLGYIYMDQSPSNPTGAHGYTTSNLTSTICTRRNATCHMPNGRADGDGNFLLPRYKVALPPGSNTSTPGCGVDPRYLPTFTIEINQMYVDIHWVFGYVKSIREQVHIPISHSGQHFWVDDCGQDSTIKGRFCKNVLHC